MWYGHAVAWWHGCVVAWLWLCGGTVEWLCSGMWCGYVAVWWHVVWPRGGKYVSVGKKAQKLFCG